MNTISKQDEHNLLLKDNTADAKIYHIILYCTVNATLHINKLSISQHNHIYSWFIISHSGVWFEF